MRKPAFCICENKDADQLRGNRKADQRLCFRYTDSTNPLLPKSENSSFWQSSVALQPGLCQTWSETPKTGFLTTRLNCSLPRADRNKAVVSYWQNGMQYQYKLITYKHCEVLHKNHMFRMFLWRNIDNYQFLSF